MTKKTSDGTVKTNLHAIFGTDERLEEGGAWVTVNEIYKLRVKVRRLRSDAVIKGYDRVSREVLDEKKVRRPEDLTNDESMEILKRQLAEYVIVDWEGVYNSNTGEEIPYSKEAALAMMEMKDFREFIYQAASERDAFREQADEEAEKN